MKYILLFSLIFLFTISIQRGHSEEEILVSSNSYPACNPELDFCRQVTSSSLIDQIVVDTVDAGPGTKRLLEISASVDGSLNIPDPGSGIDSSVEVLISVEGQGLCASDKSIRLKARNGNGLRASATCLTVIEGVKTITIRRIVGGGMINTVLSDPENTKLRYSWAKIRKVSSVN